MFIPLTALRRSGARVVAVIVACTAVGACDRHTVQWNADPADSPQYTVTRNKNFQGADFTERDDLSLAIRFAPGRSATVVFEGNASAPFTLAPDGTFTPEDANVHLLARLLFAVPREGARRVRRNSAWTVRTPADNAIRDDRLEIQLEHEVTLTSVQTSGNEEIGQLTVRGKRRVVDNPQARSLVGLPSTDPSAAAVDSAVTSLAQWSPYLSGTVSWNLTKGLPVQADFVIIPGPALVADFTALEQSIHRQKLSYARTQL